MAHSQLSTCPLSASLCVICRRSLSSSNDDWCNVSPRGLATIIEFSQLRGDTELANYLLAKPEVVSVHNECRRNYTNKRRYEQEQRSSASYDETEPVVKGLRSSGTEFAWKLSCFFCSSPVVIDDRHPDRTDGSVVQTLEIRDNMIRVCELRTDEWGLLVRGRLNSCNDLVAEEARYHRVCMQNFCKIRPPPRSTNSIYDEACASGGDVASGRRQDDYKMTYFNKVCEFLELNADRLYSISELHDVMQDIAGVRVEVYSQKWFQHLLFDRYKDHLVLANLAGKCNVVCFKDMTSTIINDKWYSDRESSLEN